jgi:hypothetical protein
MSRELLSVERYAEVLAHVQHFGVERGDEVCARMCVDAEVWEDSHAHWAEALEADSAGDAPHMAIGFGHAYGVARKRLAAEKPAIEALGPLPAPPSADDTAVAEDQAASVAAPTTGFSPSDRESGVSEPPRVVASPRPARVAAATSPWVADTPPAQAGPPPLRPGVDETALVNVVMAENPLPFVADAPERTRARLRQVERERVPSAGSTSEIPAILADPNATLPFVAIAHLPAERDLLDRLTLAQYASLCAELASQPMSQPALREQTVRRYGIDDATWPALRDVWERRLGREPHERRTFDEMFARFRAWLTHNR